MRVRALSPTGDMTFGQSQNNFLVNSSAAVAQCVKTRLMLFKGEWFRDIRVGIPYFQYVFIQNPNLTLISSLFQQVCEAAPGVAAVLDMQLNYLPRTRELDSQILVQANDGSTIVGGAGAPFIVQIAN